MSVPGSSRLPKIHAVVLDVDGTLMTSKRSISAATLAAVARADGLGVPVILASSRSPRGLAPVQATLGLTCQYLVAFQGALTGRFVGTDPGRFETLHELPMNLVQARAIRELAAAHGYSVNWYSTLTWFVDDIDERVRGEMGATGEMPTLADLSTLTALPHKLLCIGPAGTTATQLYELADTLPEGTVGRRSHTTYLEVTAAEADKPVGVHAIGTMLGIESAQVAAFGDGDNDLGMFAYAGTSVAMGNATPAMKAAATMITEDNDHDGVATALTWLLDQGLVSM